MLIIGIGNIGAKIALRLLERGASVYLKSSDDKKMTRMCDYLNEVKPKETIAVARPAEIASYDTVLFTGLLPVESNTKYFDNLNDSLILDIGKGCLSNSQITLLTKNGCNLFRLDIGFTFLQKLEQILVSYNSFKLPRKKVISDKLTLIEPGIIGDFGDVVINDLDADLEDFRIYGVCDGFGGLDKSENNKVYENINNWFKRKSSEKVS